MNTLRRGDPRSESPTQAQPWAAGFLSAIGTFTLHEGRPLLIVKSSRDLDSVQRFADTIGARANACTINGKPGLRVTVSGARLKVVMRMVWPDLSVMRRQDYNRVRARARAYERAGEEVQAA